MAIPLWEEGLSLGQSSLSLTKEVVRYLRQAMDNESTKK